MSIINITAADFEIAPKGAKCTKFQYIDFNRQYNKRKKFQNLKDSLDKLWTNIIPIVLVKLDDGNYLVDGQGRLACIYELLKNTNKSFPLQVFINDNVKREDMISHVIECNNTSTPWDILDYLKAKVYFEKNDNVTNDPGKYELLSGYIEQYPLIAHKTVIDVLGISPAKVLEDINKEWEQRFEEGLKVLDICDTFPIEQIKFNNKVIKAVNWVSLNAEDVVLENIFDNITDKDKIEILAGTAETVIAVLLDANESTAVYKSRIIYDDVKSKALARSEYQCEALLRGDKRCLKKHKLQYHHDLAFSSNGSNEDGNIRILCADHNNSAKANPIKFFEN